MGCNVSPIVRLILTRYSFTRSFTLVYSYMFEYANFFKILHILSLLAFRTILIMNLAKCHKNELFPFLLFGSI